jgi:hypothetical protein
MKINLDLTFHSDPGHGWLEVPKALLKELEINDKISSYSYMDCTNAYLEEDCDMTLFIEALDKSEKYFLEYHERYQDSSPIRLKTPYRPS